MGYLNNYPGLIGIMKFFKKFIALQILIFFCFPTVSLPQIVLNEIMFNPLFSDRTDEFIEIINISASDSFNLAGWTIQDEDGSDTIIDAGEGTILKPGQYGLILDADYFVHSQTYDNLIPEQALIITLSSATMGSRGLSNSKNETVKLVDKQGTIITSHTYSIGNKSGYSDERIDPEKPDISTNWLNSCTVHGTPGFKNSVFSSHTLDAVTIKIDPNPFSPDHDGIDDIAYITYYLPWNTATVSVKIFDTFGRLVKILQSASPSGSYNTISWDGTTQYNNKAPVGMYIIFLDAICEEVGKTVNHKKTIVLAYRL